MSRFFEPAPRAVSVAPPGFKGPQQSRTPFMRNRAAMDRAPQSWGPTVGQAGAAWAPTGAIYEPVTHGNPAAGHAAADHILDSSPRSRTSRTVHTA